MTSLFDKIILSDKWDRLDFLLNRRNMISNLCLGAAIIIPFYSIYKHIDFYDLFPFDLIFIMISMINAFWKDQKDIDY
jgi:hypothetical protein